MYIDKAGRIHVTFGESLDLGSWVGADVGDFGEVVEGSHVVWA